MTAIRTRSNRGRRTRRGWNSGATALEFALVAVPFLSLVLGVMEITYDFYSQEMLDYATQNAARQIQIGAAQNAPGGAAAFVQQSICNSLATLMSCASVSMSSQIVTDYYNLTAGTVPTKNGVFNSGGLTFCPGAAGQLVLLTTYYPASGIITPYLPVSTVVVNGAAVNMIVSTAAFMNEQFGAATGTTPAGC